MGKKGKPEDTELTDSSRTATGPSRKNIWQPDKVANNISRSLQSIDSSTKSRENIQDSEKPEEAFRRSSLFGNSKHSNLGTSSQLGASQDSFLYSTYGSGLLDSLRPHESLPQLDNSSNLNEDILTPDLDLSTFASSPIETNNTDNSNSNRNTNNKNDNSDIDEGNNTQKGKRKKMDKPEIDYGETLRGEPEADYGNTVRDTGVGGARPKTDITPPKRTNAPRHKAPPGGVRLPIADDSLGPDSSSSDRRHASKPNIPERTDKRKMEAGSKAYPESIPAPEVQDLSKMPVLREDTINACLKARYKEDLIYTRCGDIMISVNPFKNVSIYTKKEMESYNQTSISDNPHLYMISAKAYQDLRDRNTDQVILVSGESGAGKTEATKLLVQHLVSMAGSDDDSLQDKIIQVNPLLENFGNAKTVLNNNSSRFAKFLKLSYDDEFVLQSAKIQDFMLEKSRVVHYQSGESTYHSFYALLAGHENPTTLYINKGQTFRITGDFSSVGSRHAESYKGMYQQQQKVFKLIDMERDERDDVDIILAAILHIGEIQFEDDDNDCVIIRNESTVQKVARLLDLDQEKLTTALIERRGKIRDDFLYGYDNPGFVLEDSEFIQFSKKRRQADDERDALAKTLYEKLFGWIVRKINDALVPVYSSRSGSIGILDICGFEDLHKNTFEQMCINIINEHLQNFMNRKVIQDEKDLYEAEGVPIGDVHTEGINNDAVLDMFTKKHGILDIVDESSKVEVASDDAKMVRHLNTMFKDSSKLFVPSTSNRPEFSIKHFAGQVKYDGRTFIQKNSDNVGELVEECLKTSGSLLVKDLFHVPPSFTGSISMSQFKFQGSRRGGNTPYKPFSGDVNLSRSINQSTRASLKSRFGAKMPSFKSDLSNKKTHIHYFKNSLDELHRNMATAIPYFVRCIKPNDQQKGGRYDDQRVLTQLKYNGITEIARIRSCGLPVRVVKTDFVHRYGDLVKSRDFGDEHVQQILRSVDAKASEYKIGKSQVFMTGQIQACLEEDLAELRRKEEEERKRREAERLKREEEERQARALIEREERKKEEQRQKMMTEEKKKREREERERRLKEKEEEEEENRKKSEQLKKELKLQRTYDPYDKIAATTTSLLNGTTGKTVNFMDVIEEAPTPASSAWDSSVYNRTESSSDVTNNLLSANQRLGKSTDTSVTIISDIGDGEQGEGNDDEDLTSNDENGEWIDHFQVLSEEEEREDLVDLRTLKVIKAILYLFLFALLLVTLAIQKVSLVTMIMDLREKVFDGTGKERAKTYLEKSEETVSYIMLIFVICIPHAVGFILSLLKLLFSISKSPSVWTWLWVLSIECLHTLGLCLLVFRVFRYMDYFKAIYLMNVTACIPALLKLFISDRIENERHSAEAKSKSCGWKTKWAFGFVFDLLAFGLQGSAAAIAIILDLYEDHNVTKFRIFELVAALVLVSANQWENFSDGSLCGIELNDESWFKNKVLKIRYELQECRNFPNTLANLVKIGLTILLAYLLADDISLDYYTAYDNLKDDQILDKWVVVIVVVIAAFLAFNTALIALRLQMQRFSFALPLFLTTPATVAFLYLDCDEGLDLFGVPLAHGQGNDSCIDSLMVGPWYNLVIFGAWFLSLMVVCRHIWQLQTGKESNLNRLFLNPCYCGVLTTEHLMLNQRRQQFKVFVDYKYDENYIDLKVQWYKLNRLVTFQSNESIQEGAHPTEQLHNNANQNEDREEEPEPSTNHVTPMIYACATMWHETRTEMIMLLKSLHRLDLDQSLRRLSQVPDRFDPNYYEYEAHIFFDDAMEKDDENFPVPNRWVKDLVGAMTEACSSVHGKPMKLHPPVKMVTPYGGQLIWAMPGGNHLFVHLKDMDKIRNRKRWSQVMYMYFLLHYRLTRSCKAEALQRLEAENLRKGEFGLNIDEINMFLGEQHAAQSTKTFVLALDGDTDFLPSAVRILMQRMDNDNVGAACGRIHPIGKGPMIWYQKFEYAIGHWLQKASEHVFGCVLCSPGCFSLFRAGALMDANVVRRYTAEPSEPAHHLQFDQGEDRWLCTLLLQRGMRIEYAAGADAWTFAPEGFFEFFNQRRRWMPSTIANILDLLATATKTRQTNNNISLPYILYTWLLMFMTLLGPGTILMMMAGAFQLIFTLDIEWAYFWSILPAGVFTVACFWLQTKWQLLIAAALSIGYGFIMVIVIVGTIVTATTENIFHPSVIIMVVLLAIFFLTGICHPKEWTCLIHGILYLLCIPSGYLLLVIYSICNLNDVSWGTREVPTKAQRLENEAKKKKKEEEKLNKKKKTFFKRMFDSSESHIYELTNLLRTVMPKNEGGKEGQQAAILPQNDQVVKLLSAIEANTKELLERREGGEGSSSRVSPVQSPQATYTQTAGLEVPSISVYSPSDKKEEKPYKDDKKPYSKIKGEEETKPRWTQDVGLGKGPIYTVNKDEIRFWNGLMDKYLLPIRPTPAEKKKIADGLRDLRNSSAFAFILVNLLWMSLNFMFQLTKAAKIQVTYQFGSQTYNVEESVLGMSFVILLLVLLLLQFAGMIVHRFGTLQQLLSTTKIWARNGDGTIGMTDQEVALRRIRGILLTPLQDDEGMETTPPLPAQEDNPLGQSVVPSRSNRPLADDLSRSMNAYGALMEKKATGAVQLDKADTDILDQISRRFQGGKVPSRSGIGTSFRPNLPPRNSRHLSSTHRNTQWLTATGLGYTKKELEKMRPGMPVTENAHAVNRDDAQWRQMGPLGRSLKLRGMLIQEEMNKRRQTDWKEDDNAARIQKRPRSARGASANHRNNSNATSRL